MAGHADRRASGCGRFEYENRPRESWSAVARGPLLSAFPRCCTIVQAVARSCTLREVPATRAIPDRPMAAHLAAFILPSFGRSATPTAPPRHRPDRLRLPATDFDAC